MFENIIKTYKHLQQSGEQPDLHSRTVLRLYTVHNPLLPRQVTSY